MSPLRKTALVCMVLLLGLTGVTFAQGGPGYGANPQVGERFLTVRAKILRVDVGLDNTRAEQAEAILDEFMTKRQVLKQEMQVHKVALRNLLLADSDDQKAYEKALEGLLETQERLQGLRQDEIEALEPIMTPKERARFLAVMQEMRKKAGNRSHGKGPGGYGYGGPANGNGRGQGQGGAGNYRNAPRAMGNNLTW